MTDYNMTDFIKRLPMDIILLIIPYTYNLQNKNLLHDIINYSETRIQLLELYNNLWTIEMQSEDPQEYKNWLINDIFAYSNSYYPTSYLFGFGYIDNFYNLFKRNILLQTKEQIDNYVNKLKEKEVTTQINIFLGLLTMNERNDIIKAFKRDNDIVDI
jgi:hypothetical protein